MRLVCFELSSSASIATTCRGLYDVGLMCPEDDLMCPGVDLLCPEEPFDREKVNSPEFAIATVSARTAAILASLEDDNDREGWRR